MLMTGPYLSTILKTFLYGSKEVYTRKEVIVINKSKNNLIKKVVIHYHCSLYKINKINTDHLTIKKNPCILFSICINVLLTGQ